jgi:glucose/arabinose dehydrogenase
VVVEKVEIPWSILFTPDGRMLFTERPGRVRLYEKGKLVEQPYFTVPGVKTSPGSEIGLMGMCLHPDYAKNESMWVEIRKVSEWSQGRCCIGRR